MIFLIVHFVGMFVTVALAWCYILYRKAKVLYGHDSDAELSKLWDLSEVFESGVIFMIAMAWELLPFLFLAILVGKLFSKMTDWQDNLARKLADLWMKK